MKVKNCEKCKYYKYKKWTSSYKPANYHIIGLSHKYAYCEKYGTRCLNVNKCTEDVLKEILEK